MESVLRSIFERRLEEVLRNLLPPDDSARYSVRGLLPSVWRSFAGSSEPKGFAACDGSSGSVRYSGGLSVWLMRAVCVSSTEAEPLADVWVELGHRLEGRRYALRALELRLLTAAAKALPKGSIVIADGTLYPTLPPSVEILARRGRVQ